MGDAVACDRCASSKGGIGEGGKTGIVEENDLSYVGSCFGGGTHFRTSCVGFSKETFFNFKFYQRKCNFLNLKSRKT